MKLTTNQIQRLVEKIFNQWKQQNVVQFKADEKVVLDKTVEILKADYQKINDLEKEVHKMLDQLEKTNGGEFERYKMYPLIFKKLAKDKKVIL
jgi:hypothetical protein